MTKTKNKRRAVSGDLRRARHQLPAGAGGGGGALAHRPGDRSRCSSRLRHRGTHQSMWLLCLFLNPAHVECPKSHVCVCAGRPRSRRGRWPLEWANAPLSGSKNPRHALLGASTSIGKPRTRFRLWVGGSRLDRTRASRRRRNLSFFHICMYTPYIRIQQCMMLLDSELHSSSPSSHLCSHSVLTFCISRPRAPAHPLVPFSGRSCPHAQGGRRR